MQQARAVSARPASPTDGIPARDGSLDGSPVFLAHPISAGIVAVSLATVAFACYPTLPQSLLAAFIAATLVIVAVIDLERRVIPNVIVLPATAIVLISHIAIAPGRALELVVAPIAAALFLFLPNLLNASAIGMGDVKLAMLLGAAFGWGVIGALLIGLLSTAPVALAMLIKHGRSARKATLPLGPFLAFGGLVILIVPRL